MVRISEDMVRRRAEHNNGEIFSLEEVSLHQQDIEKIEHIDKWCRDLKILYLQNNLIPKIENVSRLKKLEYLNLALNNIEVIENLEGCESLQKLDLTVNFVGRLSSVESLKQSRHIRELFLVGNPCAEFQGYRQYVVACLPQLQWLDGKAIGRAERIRAGQGLEAVRWRVLEQEAEYLQRRERERREGHREAIPTERQGRDHTNTNDTLSENQSLERSPNPAVEQQESEWESGEGRGQRLSEEQEREFWEKPCAFTPESRLEAHRHLEEKKRGKDRESEKKQKPMNPRTLITADGRVMNVNETKLDFTLTEDEEKNSVILDLHVYRHMDTSLLDVDVQPTYLRVTIKGKVFQLVLPAEVKPDSSTAQRSTTTGHLMLNMPKAYGEIKPKKTVPPHPSASPSNRSPDDKTRAVNRCVNGHERLEVDPSKHSGIDLANIVPRGNSATATKGPLQLPWKQRSTATLETPVSKDFVDDPDVPPLI